MLAEIKECRLKNGQTLTIRPARKEDAAAVIDYLSIIGGESDYLTFGQGGFGATTEREEAFIEDMARSDNQLMLGAWLGGELAGHLGFNAGQRERTRHMGEVGVTVRKKYWSLGIGSELLKYLLAWARESRVIRKINLRVRSDNRRAIALYQRLGFVEEGLITREFMIDRIFYDCIQMGIKVDAF